ncbi:hypothetical protein MKK65_05055 [Methylobacterium sp. J-001]|uniref:hypothetical protein n=1 Tax=Methylobacterium sp. J-001 TaxID=2836609 RepID=UPI001FB8D324|nr:hypothetical protein [Methylobacterium sp. J-001]MCJ2115963.1 hypothetical protein [Methylobacterium sp. J-001]
MVHFPEVKREGHGTLLALLPQFDELGAVKPFKIVLGSHMTDKLAIPKHKFASGCESQINGYMIFNCNDLSY